MKSVTAYGTTRLSTPEVLYDCTIQRDGEKVNVTDNLKGRTVTMAFDVEGRTIYEKESFDGDAKFRAKAYDKDQEKMSIEYEPSNQLLTLPLSGVSTGYSMVKSFDVVDGYAGMGVIARSSLPENKLLAFVLHLSKEGITNPSFFSITLAVRLYDSRKYPVGETFQVTYDGNKDTDLAIAFRCDDWSQVTQIEFSYDAGLSQVVPSQTTMELFTAEGTIVQYDGEKVRKVFSDKGTAEFLDYQGDHPTRIEMQSWDGMKKTLLYRYDDAGREIFFRDGEGLCQETLYDKDGRVVEIREYPEEDPNLCHKTKYRYDEKGNVQETEGPLRDESGNYPAVQKSYSPATGKLLLERHPSGQVLSYGYDAQTGDLLSITSDADGLGNTTRMRYDKGFLTQLTHHGFTFDYTYDGRGRKTKIDVADVTGYLAREYTDDYADEDLDIEHGTKAVTTFKDGHTVTTMTDIRGRLRKAISDDVHDVTYQYDSSDNLSSKTDSISGEKISFTYDSDGKQLSKTWTENSQQVFKEERDYDRQERLSERSLSLGEYGTLEESYDYDGKGRLSSVYLDKEGRNLLSLTYVRDLLGRAERFDVHSQGGETLHGEIEYLHQDDHSTDYPKTLSVEMAGTEVLRESLAYDVMGRVTSVDTPEGKILYAYDRLGRLVREDNPILGETTLWSYDSAGNIRSRKRGAYTTERNPSGMTNVSYNYADDGWKDRLMAFGLEKSVYDGMGRPTTYRDKNVTWNKDGTMSRFDGINFTYDMDGIRKSMVDGEEETSFVYDGSRILSVKGKDHDILFRYLGDVLVGVQIDGRECLYVKDAFGSVKALVDAQAGTILARYVYDAWGLHKVLGNDGSELTDPEAIGNINPIRFRSYFYDSKTGLYYLIHRYYDPETGRFLSPDALSVLDEERLKINGLNLYAYCHDDPVDYVDSEGRLAMLALLLLAGFASAVVSVATNVVFDAIEYHGTGQWNPNWVEEYVGSFLGGFFGGMLSVGMGSLAGAVIGGALSQGLTSVLTQGFLNVSGKQNGLDWKQLVISMASGAIGGAIGYGIGLKFKSGYTDSHTIVQTLGRFSLYGEISFRYALESIVGNALSPSSIWEIISSTVSEKILLWFYSDKFNLKFV